MWLRVSVWTVTLHSMFCIATEKTAPSQSPASTISTPAVSAPVSPSKALIQISSKPKEMAEKKASTPTSALWEQKVAASGKIGLQTGYVSAKKGSEAWYASNATRIEFGYRLRPLTTSTELWSLLQYGAFSVAPHIKRGAVTDAFVGRVEDIGIGLEVNHRWPRWILLGQGVVGFQRIVLADQAQVADSDLPRGRSAYVQGKVAGGWVFQNKFELGPYLAAEQGLITVLETGLFLRGSF